MQPIYSFHQVLLRNTPYHDKVQMVSFITAIEISVRTCSYLRLTHTRTNQHTNKKQTNPMTHAYSYRPPQIYMLTLYHVWLSQTFEKV